MIYATVEDLEAGWRVLDDDERTRADTLLKRASSFLDEVVTKYNIDVYSKSFALNTVCCDLVQRKMESGSSIPVTSITEQVGAFAETKSFGYSRRKSWELYPEDLQLLGVSNRRATSLKIAVHNKAGEEIDW